jgi:hypothetical protein
MKSRLTIYLIGCTLLTLLSPTSLLAQPKTDAEYLTWYGTSRRAQTCPSRSEPMTGRLSVAQAIKYTRCFREGERQGPSRNRVHFLDILSLQLSPPRKASESESLHHWNSLPIDRTQPIYDIKARAIYYSCSGIYNNPAYPNTSGSTGKNCQVSGADTSNSLNSYGVCFKDLTKNWICQLTVVGKTIDGSPPAN